jgi:hypothetical protein
MTYIILLNLRYIMSYLKCGRFPFFILSKKCVLEWAGMRVAKGVKWRHLTAQLYI